MAKESFNWSDEEFFEILLAPPSLNKEVIKKCELLLRDYLFCLYGGFAESKFEISQSNSSILDATQFSKLSSLLDLDDVNWPRLSHPGSIVISSVMGIALNEQIDISQLSAAITCGYGAFHLFATGFDDSNREKWHSTATAGVFGSAMAASTLLELKPTDVIRAIKFAGTAAGGSSNVAHARNGATRFTRAQATSLGLLSTYEAKAGSPGPENLFFGPGGLSSRYSITTEIPNISMNDGLEATSLRYFPWSGFMHQALFNLNQLLPIEFKTIQNVQINLPIQLFELVGRENHGPWWSIKDAVKSTLISGSPMKVCSQDDLDKATFQITVTDWENAFGLITIDTSSTNHTIEFGLPSATKQSVIDKEFLEIKWKELGGSKTNQIHDFASAVFSNAKAINFSEGFNKIFY